ncbi:MAG TPA: ATP-binding protein [Rectinemataceae bacterium]|nr:ATP-binding protein [Rectinemataceae bacterium]
MTFNDSLRFRTAMAFAVLLLSLLALDFLSVSIVERRLRARAAEEGAVLARSLAAAVENYLSQPMNGITVLASRLDADRSVDKRTSLPLLDAFGHAYSFFERILVLDPDGRLRACWPPDPLLVGLDYSGFDWFSRSLQSTSVVWSYVERSSAGNEPAVTMAIRSRSVVTAGILSLSQLRRQIGSLSPGGRGFVALVDETGTYIAHPDPAVAESREVDPNLYLLRPELDLRGSAFLSRDALGRSVAAFGLSLNGWTALVYRPESETLAVPLEASLALVASLLLGALLAAAALGSVFRLLGATVRGLGAYASSIALGDYGARYAGPTYREAAAIVRGIDNMREAVYHRERDLKDLTETLEARVRERSDRLVMSEKMAALGLVAAGVAHEINNPLAAVAAANRSVTDFLTRMPVQVLASLAALSPDEQALLRQLVQDAGPSVLAGRKRLVARRSLAVELEGRGVADADVVAEQALELGALAGEPDSVAAIVSLPGGRLLLGLAEEIVAGLRNCTVVEEAVGRASRYVGALVGYARTGEAPEGSRSVVDVVGGIELALTLFHNQMKRGVDLHKDYAGRACVLGDEDALSRVWMNLIANALQAMEYQGRLDVLVRQEGLAPDSGIAAASGMMVRVEIRDTGSGVPPELADHIFEPFVTSKRPGEGTGLGLDMTRRTVESAGGRIFFSSRPGDTLFTVLLPAEPEGGD